MQITPGSAYTGLDGPNNFVAANDSMANMASRGTWYAQNPGSLSDAVSRMLSKQYNSTWGAFASTKWVGDKASTSSSLSLEYLHNNVHVSPSMIL